MSEEKRKFARANYPCSLTILSEDGTEDVVMAYTANISAGGVMVYLNSFKAVGKNVDVRINDTQTAIDCHGRVVRCQDDPNATGRFYGVGIEFTDMGEQDRQMLIDLLQRLFKKKEQDG